MTPPPIILASASPRRRELLDLLGWPFEVVPGDAVEITAGAMTPSEACQLNAYRKARSIAKRIPDAVVIGADTEVCLGPKTLGKPADLAEAGAMLQRLSGRAHQVVTGVCLLHLRKHLQVCFAEMTDVHFHRLSPAQRSAYLQRIHPFDKAGAYAVQEHGHLIIERLDGSFSNVVGLPLERLSVELRRFLAIVEALDTE
ncbi:MAG TPA: septum formation protein Maf [Verrucomicrobiales bacterium]|nr:septum formation protein Maf [Verrucomicrobiales bacterium]